MNTRTVYSSIVGYKYYEGATDYLRKLKPHDSVLLTREPNNEYDANSIAVFHEGIKLGHIPRGQAKLLAVDMDQGAHTTAKLGQVFASLTIEVSIPEEAIIPRTTPVEAKG